MSEGLYEFKTGDIVRHFKGDNYIIITVAEHTETGNDLIVYKSLYEDGKVYARPLNMFYEEVPEGKPNPTGQKYRFEKVYIESVNK